MHEPHTSKTRRLLGRAPRTRSVIAATGLLVICVAPFANAKTGQPLREGVRNGTTTSETEVISNIGSTLSTTGGYSTRQSNLSNTGGGAIYGCRSGTGGSAAKPRPQNPCVRANNLSSGYAFEFNASKGVVGGLISVGAGGDTRRPFITNATGVALGLNADRLDGLDAAAIIAAARTKAGLDADTVDGESAEALKTRWALVNEKGVIEAQSGGFTVLDPYTTNQNIYIDSGEELADNGLTATIAIQNGVDVDGAAGADPNFGGEISVARCQVAGIVECAPGNAKNTKAFVVGPRNSDGGETSATTRKRFYVTITE
jgi:hypothetical protein